MSEMSVAHPPVLMARARARIGLLNGPQRLVVFSVFLAVIGVLSAIATLLAWKVDINEFSMHHFYRNRLIRCYPFAEIGRAFSDCEDGTTIKAVLRM